MLLRLPHCLTDRNPASRSHYSGSLRVLKYRCGDQEVEQRKRRYELWNSTRKLHRDDPLRYIQSEQHGEPEENYDLTQLYRCRDASVECLSRVEMEIQSYRCLPTCIHNPHHIVEIVNSKNRCHVNHLCFLFKCDAIAKRTHQKTPTYLRRD